MKIIAMLIILLSLCTTKSTTSEGVNKITVDRIEDGYITLEIVEDDKIRTQTITKDTLPTVSEGDVLYE